MFCISCGKTIQPMTRQCPYCGKNQGIDCLFDKPVHKKKRGKEPIFSDEEILALGLFPKDEGYKMSLISKILNQ